MSSRKLRFDGWVLDPESGDLERAGTRIRLQERPVQVLRELIAHAGSVVSREQLIALLWPKGVVDFDTGLNTVIRKLRSALGDTSETPRYIETLPRRGYRFIGALDPDPEAASGASAGVPVSTASGASPGPAPPSQHEPMALPEAALAEPRPMSSRPEPGGRDETTSSTATMTASVRRPRFPAVALSAALVVVALLAGVYALWRARPGASITSVRVEAPSQSGLPVNVAPTGAVGFAPPPHSIAVLPFVNVSGDKEQEYFSDGLTEELLNSLAHIDGLQVAARTSSFSFREHPDVADVAHKLNVSTVLEGSVRRSGHTVRVTAELISGVTGFHLWAKTYDRDLGDVLKLQTELATAVATALEVTLLGDVGAKIELGGTRNPAAFDAYLRGLKLARVATNASDTVAAIAAYSDAIRLDPNYARALAGRGYTLGTYAGSYATGAAVQRAWLRARMDAEKAAALLPGLGEAHMVLGAVDLYASLDFAHAGQELERARLLAPGSATVLYEYARFAAAVGRSDAAIEAARRGVTLDPLNLRTHRELGHALLYGRRYDEALAAYQESINLDSKHAAQGYGFRGIVYYLLGNLHMAQSSCEGSPEQFYSHVCLALVLHKLGRRSDADAEVAAILTASGDSAAYQYADIYAQWGDQSRALSWLQTALRVHDPGLTFLRVDPLLDPVRSEPGLLAIERVLKFPD